MLVFFVCVSVCKYVWCFCVVRTLLCDRPIMLHDYFINLNFERVEQTSDEKSLTPSWSSFVCENISSIWMIGNLKLRKSVIIKNLVLIFHHPKFNLIYFWYKGSVVFRHQKNNTLRKREDIENEKKGRPIALVIARAAQWMFTGAAFWYPS